jgi:hypothetical protein
MKTFKNKLKIIGGFFTQILYRYNFRTRLCIQSMDQHRHWSQRILCGKSIIIFVFFFTPLVMNQFEFAIKICLVSLVL